jgi:hypothetical protein
MNLYHCVWIGGNLTDHHKLCLYSLIATQKPPFRIIWWTFPDYVSDICSYCEKIGISPDVLGVRIFDVHIEAKDTPFEGHEHRLMQLDMILKTDQIRCIACYKYGGFYFDFDVLFLRDMTEELASREFVYRWERQDYANDAVMHLHPKSPIGRAILERILAIGKPYAPDIFTLAFAESVGLEVLPCEMFDLGWLPEICDPRVRFDNFFKPSDITIGEFCPGAYTYHWHNKWDSPILPDSIAGKFLEHYSHVLKVGGDYGKK